MTFIRRSDGVRFRIEKELTSADAWPDRSVVSKPSEVRARIAALRRSLRAGDLEQYQPENEPAGNSKAFLEATSRSQPSPRGEWHFLEPKTGRRYQFLAEGLERAIWKRIS
jgi:hypothetical protein